MGLPKRSPGRNAPKCLALLRELLETLHPRDFALRLWDGSALEPGPGRPARFTLAIRNPSALRALVLSPDELSLGEAYIRGDLDVEGEIGAIFRLADHLARHRPGMGERLRWARLLYSLPGADRPGRPLRRPKVGGRLHSISRDRKAVTYHYDVSSDFYALWLDRRMVYSCGYFSTPQDDIDAAQERKLDLVCRKLRLRPGERLLDIGCGWGGLLIHAARRYGVEGVGITVSRPQADFANAKIREAGLYERCRAERSDYREMEGAGVFDKVASIGMVEHVGVSSLPVYFRRVFRMLRPGGAFLSQGIACNPAWPAPPGPSFSDHYVFPDGELPPVSTTLRAAEEEGFEIRDLENLREHYLLTLLRWRRRLEARRDDALRIAGERIYRIWRLYLAGAAHTFSTGKNNVFQALLVKPDGGRAGLPLTREDWYRPSPSGCRSPSTEGPAGPHGRSGPPLGTLFPDLPGSFPW